MLSDIFSELFDLPSSEFNYETSRVTLEIWDSLTQINLIAAVQEEFDLDIPPEQQLDMLSFELFGGSIANLLNVDSSSIPRRLICHGRQRSRQAALSIPSNMFAAYGFQKEYFNS